MARVQPDVDLLQQDEALHQETGADEEHDGERRLGHDQQVPQPVLRHAPRLARGRPA